MTIEIKVFLNELADKPLFVRQLQFPEVLHFDADKLLDTFRFLYGLSCRVTFDFRF